MPKGLTVQVYSIPLVGPIMFILDSQKNPTLLIQSQLCTVISVQYIYFKLVHTIIFYILAKIQTKIYFVTLIDFLLQIR